MGNVFMSGLKENYLALETKDPKTIYFTEDTCELFLGDKPYNQSVKFVATRPTTPAQGILYANIVSGIVESYNGSSWVAMADIIGGKEVISYIESKSEENGTIEATKGDGTKVDVPLTGVAHDPVYNDIDMRLTIPVVGKEPVIIDFPPSEPAGSSQTLIFTNKVANANLWTVDTAYPDYGYRAAITLDGVVADMVPTVIFSPADAATGNYAPIANSYDGGAYIYASTKPESNITIPTIVAMAGTVVG